jgi:hypothetical protein|tara:strand:+ start:365 stop:613 length:249 start_codon:yes stop_codon:yes gene_type:complete
MGKIVKPSPLKGKEIERDSLGAFDLAFKKEDVAAAVAWLKQQLHNHFEVMDWYKADPEIVEKWIAEETVDAAFADVIDGNKP